MSDQENEYLRSPVFWTMLKVLAAGFVLGELVPLARTFVDVLLKKQLSEIWGDIALQLVIFIASAEILFLLMSYSLEFVVRVAKSKRFDLLLSGLLGVALALFAPKIAGEYYAPYIQALDFKVLFAFVAAPVFFVMIFLIGALLSGRSRSDELKPTYFVSDFEKHDSAHDLLNVRGAAKRFAERALNGGSSESIVFGVDAPWGTGKSTFINFCIEHWTTRANVVVYHFNPLQYEDRSHLLNKFVDGLVASIKKVEFIPELGTIVSRYSKLVSASRSINVAGIDFDLIAPSRSVEDAADAVKYALSKIDHQIVIIVDDLDRMGFSALKDMLFVIKKGFSLPNLVFVLSYDTQNITALEGNSFDDEKISEFLEKFVNVKIGLYPSSDDLKRFVGENLKLALGNNLLVDPQSLDEVLGGLRGLYDSAEYVRYLPMIGDVRKVKRLINTLVLQNIEKTDFRNTDILPRDLILLLLIYVNYPALFRQIFNSETNGRRGFYSAAVGMTGKQARFVNSEDFTKFVKTLSDAGRATEWFLLNQLFDAGTRLRDSMTASVPEAIYRSFSCFNSVDSPNLESYLNLIVRVTAPQPIDQYKFYENFKNQFKEGIALDDIFGSKEFDFDRPETSHEKLWRVISNSLEEFSSEQIVSLIRFVLKHIQDYSFLNSPALGVGLRDKSIVYSLLKFVDTGGWSDEQGLHRNNTDQNVAEIAEWVLGIGRHSNEGIIPTLASSDRGPIGWHDALLFRLYVCTNRDGSFFNLYRAMALHANPNAPTSGQTDKLVIAQMRQVSQLTFKLFREQYISKKINFLNEVDMLGVDQLSGKYASYVKNGVQGGKISLAVIDDQSAVSRVSIKMFCIYQIATKEIDFGIGCGHYDEVGGADKGGIHEIMNDYLFYVCFDENKDNDGYFHFVSYLMNNFERRFGGTSDGVRVPTLSAKVLDQEKLRLYWTTNRRAIMERKFEASEHRVVSQNYILTFKEGVPDIFDALDVLCQIID